MRYNRERDIANYIGEIEFLTKQEWEKELGILFSDMTGEDGKLIKKPDPKSQGLVKFLIVQ